MANKQVDITVSLDNLTLGDLEIIDKARTNQATMTEMLDVLDRAVVGGNVRKLPFKELNQLIAKLNEAVEQESNPQ